MALEKVGLGGVLTFDEKQAVRGMNAAQRASGRFNQAFSKIKSVAQQVGTAVGQMGQAMRGLGVAALPATGALAFGTKMAMDFEQQMSAVAAITGASAVEMARLEKKAKAMGATTAFSATEAAQGMEFLSRAGFSVDEQIAALGPTLNAAAADGIELATAADIISNTLKGLGLPATDAARAADVLALTSSKANTDMVGLGEAMKFTAPQAKTLGIELETTAALLGAVADAGLKGTIGGTSLTQAMVKLTKPTAQGAKLLDDFGIVMTKTATGGLDVVDVFKQINTALKQETDVVKKARMQTEIFGLRGQKAFAAVGTAIDTGKLDELVEATNSATGAAERMAKIRLDNTAGAFTLLKSAAEGFALETAGLFLGPMTAGVQGFSGALSNVVLVLQELNSETGLTEETAGKAGGTFVAIAKGIKSGLDTVIAAFGTMRSAVMGFLGQFGGTSEETIQKLAKMATMFFVIAGAVAPVLLALGGMAFFVTTVLIPGFQALGAIAGAIFSGPVAIGIGIAAAALFLFHTEGDTLGETFTRLTSEITTGFNWIVDNGIAPFVDGIKWFSSVWDFVSMRFLEITRDMKEDFNGVAAVIVQAAQFLSPIVNGIFLGIGNVVGAVASTIGLAFVTVFSFLGGVVRVFSNVAISTIEAVVNAVKGTAEIIGLIMVGLGDTERGQKLLDFGKGEFRVKRGGQTSLGGSDAQKASAEKSKLEMMADLEAQAIMNEGGGLFTPGDINSISSAVGDAMKGMPTPQINVEAKMCVDGKQVAKATAKHKQEVKERSGANATPWQRRALVGSGADPLGSS